MTRLVMTAAVSALLLVPGAASAQRRGGREADTTAPVATNTIARHADALVGKVVTVTAGVETVLAPGAFVVDQRKVSGPGAVAPAGSPLLVLVPRLSGTVAPAMQLAVKGQLVLLDKATLARLAQEHALPSAAATYEGGPALVATSVLTSTQQELVAAAPAPAPAAASTTAQ